MQASRDQPVAAVTGQLRIERQREGDETHLCVAGLHELGGLGNILPEDQFRLDLFPHAGGTQCFLGALAVGRMLGIGDGDAGDCGVGETRQGHSARHLARPPQDDTPDRIRLDLGCSEPSLGQFARIGDVRREEQIVGRALPDLRIKLPRRTVDNLHFVLRIGFPEGSNDFVHCEPQVSGCRDGDFLCLREGRKH